MWMGKLEACRQAASAARDASLAEEAVEAKLAEEGVPTESGVGVGSPEPSAVVFDDSDSD